MGGRFRADSVVLGSDRWRAQVDPMETGLAVKRGCAGFPLRRARGPRATSLFEIRLAALPLVNEWGWASDLYEIVRANPDFERFRRSAIPSPLFTAKPVRAGPLQSHHGQISPAPRRRSAGCGFTQTRPQRSPPP